MGGRVTQYGFLFHALAIRNVQTAGIEPRNCVVSALNVLASESISILGIPTSPFCDLNTNELSLNK